MLKERTNFRKNSRISRRWLVIKRRNEMQAGTKERGYEQARGYYGSNEVFKSRTLSENLKIQVYRTSIGCGKIIS